MTLSVANHAATDSSNDEVESVAPSLLETVLVTTDRHAVHQSEISGSVFSIDSEAINDVAAIHIGEVLQRVPGLVFHHGSGQESLIGLRSPVLTGAGSCGAFQISQDGIPVRGAGFCNVNQLFDVNSEQAAAIEVVRGPGSVLFGANAIHGAINNISFNVNDKDYSQVLLDLGSYDFYRLRIATQKTDNQHSFSVKVNLAELGGYVDESGYGQQKFSLAHQYSGDISISSVLSATNLNQETASYLTGTDSYKDKSLRTDNENPEAFRDAKSIRFHSRIEADHDDGSWMVTPYFRYTDMTFLMHFLPGTPLEENGHHSVGVQSMFTREFGKKEFGWGLDVEYNQGYLKQSQDGGFGVFPSGQQYDYEVISTLISPFAMVKYQLSDSNSLSASLRLERLIYDYDNQMIDGNTAEDGLPCSAGSCRYSRPADRKDKFNNATLSMGWIHLFSDESQLYGNVSTAFRAPQSTELYRLQAGQSVTDLDSEKVSSIELGLRASRAWINYELVAYYMTKRDVIFQDNERNNVSGGETSHRGIEFVSAIRLLDSLSLLVNATYAKHRYEANVTPIRVMINLDGKEIDTAPEFVANANLSWQIKPNHSVTAEWVHVGDYYTDESNLHSYPGHDLFNLRYQYQSESDWQFSVRVKNLTNKLYAERADYSGFSGDRYFVGDPRSVYFTAGLNF